MINKKQIKCITFRPYQGLYERPSHDIRHILISGDEVEEFTTLCGIIRDTQYLSDVWIENGKENTNSPLYRNDTRYCKRCDKIDTLKSDDLSNERSE